MRAFGWLLIVLGMLIAGWGIYGAVSALAQTYQHAMEDPLGESEVDENTDLPRTMLIHAAIGACGVLPSVPGLFILRAARVRHKHASIRSEAEKWRAKRP